MRATLLVGALALGGCRRATEDVENTAIIVVMDGVRVEESFCDSPTSATGEAPWEILPESWATLVPQGARATSALNIGATITGPAHSAMISGRRQPLANYPVEAEPGLYRPELPGLGEAVRAQRALRRPQTVVIENTLLIKPVAHSLWPRDGYRHGAEQVFVGKDGAASIPSDSDPEVIAKLITHLRETPTNFALINLHAVDRAGHFGDTDAYPEHVHELDSALVTLWQAIQDSPVYADHTWLVIMADHGRHRDADTDPPWRDHGDACLGCRQIPLLVVGPGVRAGETVDTPILVTDVAPTLAALMGIDLPWADGLIAQDLLTEPLPGDRSGVAEVAVSGGLTATVRYTDDHAHRKVVQVEDTVFSEAFEAEGVSLAREGDRAWACWRELATPELSDPLAFLPWRPRCVASEDGGTTWQDVGAPEDEVGPFWSTALVPTQDGVIAVYPHNPNGIASPGVAEDVVGLRAARLAGDGWHVSQAGGVLTFPTSPAGVLTPSGLLAAVSAAPYNATARDLRRIYTSSGSASTGALGELADEELTDDAPAEWRVERPALFTDNQGRVWMAAVGYSDQLLSQVVVTTSEDDGQHWSAPIVVPSALRAMPHLPPAWLEGEPAQVVFGALDEDTGEAYVCAGTPDLTPQCVPVGSERILDLAVDGDRVLAVVDAGVGEWELTDLGAAPFRR